MFTNFLTSFSLIGTFLFLNLFVAVLIEGSAQTAEVGTGNTTKTAFEGEMGLTETEYTQFCTAWLELDPMVRTCSSPTHTSPRSAFAFTNT
jgi:hypothetical protein